MMMVRDVGDVGYSIFWVFDYLDEAAYQSSEKPFVFVRIRMKDFTCGCDGGGG